MSRKLCCALPNVSYQEAQDVNVSLMVRLTYYLVEVEAARFVQ